MDTDAFEEDYTGSQLAMVAEYAGSIEQGLIATNYVLAHFAVRVYLALHHMGLLEYDDAIQATTSICEALGVPVEVGETNEVVEVPDDE